MNRQFVNDFLLGLVVTGIGFVAPYCACAYWLGLPEGVSLLCGWIVHSLFDAWLMGGDDGEDGD